MDSIKLTVEIVFTPIEVQEMPRVEKICDKVTEYIYDYILDDSAWVQMTQVTHINGRPTKRV